MSGQAEVGGIPLAVPFGLWPFHKAANAHAELGAGQMAAGALPANISQPRAAEVQVLGTCPLLILLCHRLLACQKPLQDALLIPCPIPLRRAVSTFSSGFSSPQQLDGSSSV